MLKLIFYAFFAITFIGFVLGLSLAALGFSGDRVVGVALISIAAAVITGIAAIAGDDGGQAATEGK